MLGVEGYLVRRRANQ